MLVRQRPGPSKGVVFITIKDETGFADLGIRLKLDERQRPVILSSRTPAVNGPGERKRAVAHLAVNRVADFSHDLAAIGDADLAVPSPHGRGRVPPRRN